MSNLTTIVVEANKKELQDLARYYDDYDYVVVEGSNTDEYNTEIITSRSFKVVLDKDNVAYWSKKAWNS
jgi:molybdopterin-guanine dinucleotide biosynthesis protein